jgi:hypothetical protein
MQRGRYIYKEAMLLEMAQSRVVELGSDKPMESKMSSTLVNGLYCNTIKQKITKYHALKNYIDPNLNANLNSINDKSLLVGKVYNEKSDKSQKIAMNLEELNSKYLYDLLQTN